MGMPLAVGSGRDPQTPSHELVMRAMREFEELPALRLTLEQAMRLLSAERAACQEAFDALIEVHVLERDRTGRYARCGPQ